MKNTKRKKINKISLIDSLHKSNPEAEAMLDLVGRFPLKESMEIITKTSGWQTVKNQQTTSQGIALFARY